MPRYSKRFCASAATSAETGANGVAKHDALQRLWSTRLGPRNNIDPRELVRLMEAELMHLGLEGEGGKRNAAGGNG